MISGTKGRKGEGGCVRRSGNIFHVFFFLSLFQMKTNISPAPAAHLSVVGSQKAQALLLLASTKLGRTGWSTLADLNQAVLYGPSQSCLYLLQEPTDSLEDSLLSSRPEFIIGPEGEEEENPASKHGENPGTRPAPSEHAGRWTWLTEHRVYTFWFVLQQLGEVQCCFLSVDCTDETFPTT